MKIVKKIICLYKCFFHEKWQNVEILQLDKGIFRKFFMKDNGCFVPLYRLLQEHSIYPCED
jgi:hypothetical protein